MIALNELDGEGNCVREDAKPNQGFGDSWPIYVLDEDEHICEGKEDEGGS